MRIVNRKVELVDDGDEQFLYMWCPGCEQVHGITVCGPGAWQWNRSQSRPTIQPPILFRDPTGGYRCHSVIQDGHWQFLTDCTHALAGSIVEMSDWPPPRTDW